MTEEQIFRLVQRMHEVPDADRNFTVAEAEAKRIHRLPAETLAALLDYGIPHRSTATGIRFDEFDLANASLTLGLPSPRYLAMRRWPEVLRAVAAGKRARYSVEVTASCPGHEGACRLEPTAAVRQLGPAIRTTPTGFTLTHEFDRPETPDLAEAFPVIEELCGLVSDLEFFFLPERLHTDLDFLERTSLADCLLATRYLVREAGRLHLEARLSYGLLLASPYSLEHCWPEVRVAGRWLPFDPHLINSLVRWGILKSGEISPDRCLDGAFFRLGEAWSDLVLDAGRPAPTSFLTRRVETKTDRPSARPARPTSVLGW